MRISFHVYIKSTKQSDTHFFSLFFRLCILYTEGITLTRRKIDGEKRGT